MKYHAPLAAALTFVSGTALTSSIMAQEDPSQRPEFAQRADELAAECRAFSKKYPESVSIGTCMALALENSVNQYARFAAI